MPLAVPHPLPAMEARVQRMLPDGDGWQYEPKWDGFRCLVFRDRADVQLQSKAEKPLARYFPEVVERMRAMSARKFVLDGELVIPSNGSLSFDDLLQRIHPAASRITKLSEATPATFIAFDLLEAERGGALLDQPLRERRARLESFAERYFVDGVLLSPATTDIEEAKGWFKTVRGGLDGVIAKRLDEPYASGERDAMVKVKHLRTADCVVGGFRRSESKPPPGSAPGSPSGKRIASLLLGLYNKQGELDHVGFTSSLSGDQRAQIEPLIERLAAKRAKATKATKAMNMEPAGFTGKAPGGPSRWSTERSREWEPLPHELVVEVEYDHFSQGRFRHGTKFLRRRPEKAPIQCTYDQMGRRQASALQLVGGAA